MRKLYGEVKSIIDGKLAIVSLREGSSFGRYTGKEIFFPLVDEAFEVFELHEGDNLEIKISHECY